MNKPHRKCSQRQLAVPDISPLLNATWYPGEVVITESSITYHASEGMRLRTLPCIICDQMIGGSKFTIYHFTYEIPCASGGSHLTTMTVIRHIECSTPGYDKFYQLVLDKLGPCFNPAQQ